jgi:hypothetical protein
MVRFNTMVEPRLLRDGVGEFPRSKKNSKCQYKSILLFEFYCFAADALEVQKHAHDNFIIRAYCLMNC